MARFYTSRSKSNLIWTDPCTVSQVTSMFQLSRANLTIPRQMLRHKMWTENPSKSVSQILCFKSDGAAWCLVTLFHNPCPCLIFAFLLGASLLKFGPSYISGNL